MHASNEVELLRKQLKETRDMLAGFVPVVQAFIIMARAPAATNGQRLGMLGILDDATKNTAAWLANHTPD